MESNINANYNYDQLIIKRNHKNVRKIIIPKSTRSCKQLKRHRNQQFQSTSFPLIAEDPILLPTATIEPPPIIPCQGHRPAKRNNKRISKHFDAKLMENILPWTYLSNSLREAAKDGNLNLVIELIRNGADINEADRFGNTPLWLAYSRDHYKIVVELINSGVDVNMKTGSYEISDFHRACGWGTTSFVKFLLKCDAKVDSTDVYGKTPLLFAVDFKLNCLDLIDLLIEHGASINHQDNSGLSSLHYASIRGKVDVVEKLLNLNANPDCLNTNHYSPLTYSLCYISFMSFIQSDAYSHRLKIVKLLIESINITKMKQSIVGNEKTPNLVTLFNFIFYGRSQSISKIELLGWTYYDEITLKADAKLINLFNDQLFTIAQYLIMYNQNLNYFVYFIQRIQLAKLNEFLLFYLINFFNEKKNILRIYLLVLYSLLSDDGESLKYLISDGCDDDESLANNISLNASLSSILSINSNQNVAAPDENHDDNEQLPVVENPSMASLTAMQAFLVQVLKFKSKRPFSLKCLSRRQLRINNKNSIFYLTKMLNVPKSLKYYILYEELDDFVYKNDCSLKYLFEFMNKI